MLENSPAADRDGQLSLITTALPLEELAVEINTAHAEAQAHASKAVERALQAGDLLLTVKARLNHGEFGPWCSSQLPDLSRRTIQDYMRVARELPAEKRSAAHLPSSIREVLRLAASEPDPEPAPGPVWMLPWNRTSNKTAIAQTVRAWPDLMLAATIYMDANGQDIESIANELGIFKEEIEPLLAPCIPVCQELQPPAYAHANFMLEFTLASATHAAWGWAELGNETELASNLHGQYRLHERRYNRFRQDIDNSFELLNFVNYFIGAYLKNCALGWEYFSDNSIGIIHDAVMCVCCTIDYAILDSKYGFQNLIYGDDDKEEYPIPFISDEKRNEYFKRVSEVRKKLAIPFERLGTATLDELFAEKKRLYDNYKAIFNGDASIITTEARP